MSDARDRLNGKATDAIYRARDTGLMMHDAGAAMVDAVIDSPDDLLAVLVEAGVLKQVGYSNTGDGAITFQRTEDCGVWFYQRTEDETDE